MLYFKHADIIIKAHSVRIVLSTRDPKPIGFSSLVSAY